MGRDANRDSGGDQAAAWRDLVARLALPSPVDPANAPWPDRENLRGAATTAEEGSQPESRTANGQEAPANRGRVIRPASFMRSADPADGSPTSSSPVSGAEELASGWDLGPLSQHAHQCRATDDDYLDQPTTPDLGFLDFDDDDADCPDGRYVPPPVPPLPKLDPVARGAWAALFGGPGYLFIATMLGWQIPGWAELVAIAAFVTGFVVLVSRLGDGPSRRDGPDQGAVV